MADLAASYPTTPSFTAFNFRINTPTQLSETFSGKFRRVGMGTSYYTWDVQYTNLVPIDAGTVKGFIAQALGPQFSFNIVLPYTSYTKLTNQTTQAVTLRSLAAAGSTNVPISGEANKNILAAGDFFKFNNHSKVYMCVSPCTTNAQGQATLFFSGPMVTAAANSTALTITAVPFTAVLAEDVQEWEVGFGGITQMNIAMREVF